MNYKKKARNQPYFLIPYTDLARKALAKKDIRKVENLIRQGLAETLEGEIKYFRKLLCLPLLILYRELEERKQDNLASLIRERYKKLFPASGIKGN